MTTNTNKRKAECIHCKVEDMVPKDKIKVADGNDYWACEPCIKEKREMARSYKMVFMDQGIFGATLLEDINQEELSRILHELLTVHKGVVLSLEEVTVKRKEKAQVLH
ncbi:hypothetical protein [Bacillus phage vB_BceM_Bc431v3]|uniref:Uncharacterized protein n=1 Tax=Bacillus phage vB_BceM_Bc431v3 TaxID=1195072 RepID=M4HNF6_9CAUD|nr:hypothetical protein K201_gp061 [Bacillus phage vB_BceM_Bc431v3]AFQ96369.1 hypothetical protein [Bacillus phage vB_BceM_Bc431v3]